MTTRKWKHYPDNVRYYISTKGDVVRRSIDPRAKKFKKLKPVIRGGYLFVSIGKDKQKPVHALVLETFDRKRRKKEVCRHLNGIKSDNRLKNLKWGTYKQNEDDKILHGTKLFGDRVYNCRLTNKQIRDIFTSTKSLRSLSNKYNVTLGHIRSIKRSNRHGLVTKDLTAGSVYMGKPSGHEHGRSELTKSEARRVMLAKGSYAEIAETFGISKHIVGAIKRKDRYSEATVGLQPPVPTRRNRRKHE